MNTEQTTPTVAGHGDQTTNLRLIRELTELLETQRPNLSDGELLDALKARIAEYEPNRDDAEADGSSDIDALQADLDALDGLREDIRDVLNDWMDAIGTAKREADEWLSMTTGALSIYFLGGTTVGDVEQDPLLWCVKGDEVDPAWRYEIHHGMEYVTYEEAQRHIAAVERQINRALHNIDHLARECAEELTASFAQGPGAYIVQRVHEAHQQLHQRLGEERCECLVSMGHLNIAWETTLTPVKIDFMPKKTEGLGMRVYDLSGDELADYERTLSDAAEEALTAAVGNLRLRFERQVTDYAASNIIGYLQRFNECASGMRRALLGWIKRETA